MTNYIKTYEEYINNDILIKPKPDFSGLTISDKDFKQWYKNYKSHNHIPLIGFDHESNILRHGALYEKKYDILPLDEFAKKNKRTL